LNPVNLRKITIQTSHFTKKGNPSVLHVIYLSFSIEFLISKEISSCNLFLGSRDVPQDFRLFEQMHLRRQTGASVSQEIRHRCNGLPAKPKAILLQFAVESRAEVDIKKMPPS